MRRTLMGAAAAGALFVTLTACGDSVAPASTGQLSVMLTDAPFPFDQVARADMFVVRIDTKMGEATDAEVQNVGTSLQTGGLSNTDPRRDWVTVATPSQSYNMLDLQHGTATGLGQLVLPTGRYRSFRLVLDTRQSSITLKDGTVLTGSSVPGIVWPSAGLTGIRVDLVQPVSVAAAGTAMMLDFDLGRSFLLRGTTIREGLLFSPVIRGATLEAAPSSSPGAVAGTLACGSDGGPSTPVASGTVELLKLGTDIAETSPDSVVATTATDASGAFRLDYLAPGDYSVRATRPAGSASCANSTLIPGIVVSAGVTSSIQLLLPGV